MSRAGWVALGAVASVVFASGGLRAAWPQDGAPETATVGRAAPEIQVSDWIGGDGRASLADFRGDVVLLDLFATSCPVSRGQVAHLARLQEEHGTKGFTVVAITTEDRRSIRRYMAHEDASFTFPVAIGSAAAYPAPTLPHAALIGPDGKVAWLGNPASLPGREIEALLRKVTKPTPAEQESRARTMLASAETLIASRDVARAEAVLAKIASRYGATESGRRAAARAKELGVGELAAELAAQHELAKLVGGTVERPEKADSRRMQKLARTFERKAEEWRETAPRAAELALEWREIASTTWARAQDAAK